MDSLMRLSLSKGSQGEEVDKKIYQALYRPAPTTGHVLARGPFDEKGKSVEERLFDSLAVFKAHIAQVAMHMDNDWRHRLFGQLDDMMAAEDWDPRDLPPSLQSFATFLRTMLFLSPEKRPGLALTGAGHITGSWTDRDRRLTVEFLPHDNVRWVVSYRHGLETETFAGSVKSERLWHSLTAYSPSRWFGYVRQSDT